ncbi:hemolysin secretion protein D [Novosphingobium colocasiae]|uniref:Hemolysin secretion protein D n=2 Tax=Novosphingobium colocasiae TaxID=1256513 RepID=A0A918PD12_9SPHN|nr:hemolysin secretion protein D [Novosphingobium colocasiae]
MSGTLAVHGDWIDAAVLMNYDARIDVQAPSEAVMPDADPALSGAAPEIPGYAAPASRRRVWIIGGAVALAVIAAVALLHRAPPEEAAGADDSQIPHVSVSVPGRSTVAGVIKATGTLAARREMPVGSVGEGGQVRAVLVEPGDWVSKGQVLAVIDSSVQSEQVASQAAQVQVAQADARLAQANLDRALKLVDRGFISKADVDRLTATRDAANARVAVARATLGQLRAQTARLNILAPDAGLVLTRAVEPGQVVGGGTGVLFSIARGGEMELRAQLSEDDLARVSVGNTAQVTPVGSGKVFTGQIWQISPVINAEDRQGQARIALPYAPELRPGGFASVQLRSGTMVAPTLPESAILNDEQGSYVYIIGKDNKVQRRAVKIGTVGDDGIAIAEGLNGSEAVVLRAGGFLAPGQAVVPRRVSAGQTR